MSRFLIGALAAALLAVVVAADASAQTPASRTVTATSNANRTVTLTISGTRVSAAFTTAVAGIVGMRVTNLATGFTQTYESQSTATLEPGRYDIEVFIFSSFGIRSMRDSATFRNVEIGGS